MFYQESAVPPPSLAKNFQNEIYMDLPYRKWLAGCDLCGFYHLNLNQ